ncbi:TPA: hypothetical protein ACGPBJ_001316 [Streptococcus suis]
MIAIKENIDKIENDETRKGLEEVISNIDSNNYRSAIVVLYTTLLYDILKQLESLRDFYNNDIARSMLDEVFTKKSENPTSSKWESDLLTELGNRNFISNTEVKDLQRIRQLRNYGAHPIVEDDDSNVEVSLRPIEKYEVLDAQEKAYKIIFARQLGLGKKYISEIMTYSLERINDAPHSFEQQFSDKYLKKLNKVTYRNLFKIFFRAMISSDDIDAQENRENLVIILKTMFYFNSEYCVEFFSESNFEMLSIIPDDFKTANLKQIRGSKIYSLITFFKYCPRLFYILPPEKQNIIINFCKDMYLDKNPINDNLSSVSSEQRNCFKEKGRFLSSTLFYFDNQKEYFNTLKKVRTNVSKYNNGHIELSYIDYLNSEDFRMMLSQCEYLDMMDELREFVKEYISESNTFDGATKNIDILTSIDFKFSENDIVDILQSMNENNQYYGSRDWKKNIHKFSNYYENYKIESKLFEFSNLSRNM